MGRSRYLTFCVLTAALGSASGAPLGPAFLQAAGHLEVDVGKVKVLHDLCVTQVPNSKAVVDAAYDDWMRRHRDFVAQVERIGPTVDRHHDSQAPKGSQGITSAQMTAMLEHQLRTLESSVVSLGSEKVAATCAEYPSWTRSEKTDFDKTDAALLAVVQQESLK